MAHTAFTLPWLQLEERACAVIGATGGIGAGNARDPRNVGAWVSLLDRDEEGASVDAVAGYAQREPDRRDVRVDSARIMRKILRGLLWAGAEARDVLRW
jgi:hypothetical protein